jgi:pimeloyl-ACP methyl ester carboxylesterase
VADPSSIDLEYENINFKTEDGVNLNGWWVPMKGAKGTLLFCHGNGGNISFLLDTIRIFNSLGLNVLVFDYRGYGKSGGSPTEEGTYLDARAAWQFLRGIKKIEPDKIILAGRSLGGSIAAWLGRNYRPRVLILESTFTKAADVADFHYMIKPGCVVFGNAYNTEERLSRVECPVLIVHSPDDEIIPYAFGRRLFERARTPKEFLEIRGSHNSGFLESMAEYRAGLNRFISKYL